MIEPKELRIGNKLQKDNGEVYTILRLDNTQDVLVEEQRGLLTLNHNLFGIPITEEWLIKLGFEKVSPKSYTIYINQTLQILIFVKPILVELKFNYSKGCIGNTLRHVQHIHHLQNLFYALTGEELKLIE